VKGGPEGWGSVPSWRSGSPPGLRFAPENHVSTLGRTGLLTFGGRRERLSFVAEGTSLSAGFPGNPAPPRRGTRAIRSWRFASQSCLRAHARARDERTKGSEGRGVPPPARPRAPESVAAGGGIDCAYARAPACVTKRGAPPRERGATPPASELSADSLPVGAAPAVALTWAAHIRPVK
jgi:hypothetical protein